MSDGRAVHRADTRLRDPRRAYEFARMWSVPCPAVSTTAFTRVVRESVRPPWRPGDRHKLVVCAVDPDHPVGSWLGNDHVSRLYAGRPFHVPSLDAITIAIAARPWATDSSPLMYQPTPVPRATRPPQLCQRILQTNPVRVAAVVDLARLDPTEALGPPEAPER
jgi:hypothetical protein